MRASRALRGDGDDAVEENLQCGICQDILYKPVSLQPCLHAFCGACFCEWAKRNDKCPQCRNSVRVVARNHAIGNIVDAYLAKHPEITTIVEAALNTAIQVDNARSRHRETNPGERQAERSPIVWLGLCPVPREWSSEW